MTRKQYIQEVQGRAGTPGVWFVVPFGTLNALPQGVHSIDTLAERLADLQEAAGVVWDPEEEPLPGRLAVGVDARTGQAFLKPEDSPGWRTDAEKEGAYREAARRYNAWPELEAIVEEPARGSDMYHLADKLDRIARILRGS